MKQTIAVKGEREVLSLISGVAFANVPSWYGATRRDLKMDILAPKVREGAPLRPALVWICGGAYMVVDHSVWAPEMQYFARRGFVVLNVSAYGTGLSDQPIYDEARQGVDGFNMMVAINGLYDAINYVRSLHFVDPTRIGAVGHSMGAMRTFAAACMDSGYLSMNDQMLNVLHEVFGQTIGADQINDDADAMAKELLTEEQLAHYETIKAEKQAHYDTRIKAEVALGIGGGSSAFQQTVTVAGHEVTRSAQTNIAFVTGADTDSGATSWGG